MWCSLFRAELKEKEVPVASSSKTQSRSLRKLAAVAKARLGAVVAVVVGGGGGGGGRDDG